MKDKKFSFWIVLLAVVGLMIACSDYGYSDGYGEGNSGLSLDPDLYGTWTHGEGDEETSYTFNSDGSCVQYIYYEEYDWKWEIEDGRLKFFVDGGIPTYKTYKIEGNKLYFWSDFINDWALPFTKK